MKCPFCTNIDTIVKDSRETESGAVIRRRRRCNSCNSKFTTFERVQLKELVVVKKSGAKKPFDRNKIFDSIATAVRKRNIDDIAINAIVNRIVLDLETQGAREVTSRKIGEIIMEELAKLDPVAYIRFASVYKDFSTVQDFTRFINKIS